MNPKNLLIAAGLGFAFILTSCSGKKHEANTVVKTILAKDEAAVLISIKVKDLLAKGGLSTKENIPSIAQMMFPDQIERLTNPEKSGLDVSGNTCIGASVSKGQAYVWAVTKISNKETFEKVLKEEEPDLKFKEVEGFTCIDKASKNGMVAWNEQCLVFFGSESVDCEAKFTELAKEFGNEHNIDAKYTEVLENKADMAWLNNADKMVELQQSMPNFTKMGQREMDIMKKMKDKFQGSSSLLTVSFENDKVVADLKNNLSASAKKELNFFGNEGFPQDKLAALGSGEIDAFFSMNGNMEGFLNWLGQLTGSGIMEEAERETNLDVKKIMASLKGNLFLGIIGSITNKRMMFTEEGEFEEREVVEPRITVLTTVGSNYIEKLADSLMMKAKMPEGYFKTGSTEFFSFLDGQILFTNDETLAKKQSEAGTPKLEAKAAECLSKPVSFYVNINKLLTSDFNILGLDKEMGAKFKMAYGTMDINGGHAELILNNGGKNSLWTIMNIGVKLGEGMIAF